MANSFRITIEGIDVEVNSMNVLKPILFRIYVMIEGVKKRFHIHGDGTSLVFCQPDNVPAHILKLESEISGEIVLQYKL
jgi:hypothetical protein